MASEISVFLPTRKNSERVLNKNTKKFADFDNGLLQLKLNQLFKSKKVDQIVLSSNDEKCLDIGNNLSKTDKRLKVVERPSHLALSTTDLVDLVNYVPKICDSEHILWTHVTSPFVDEHDYDNAVEVYLENLNNNFDSLMSVKKFQNFLWSLEKNDIINRNSDKKWPRTQDLKKLFEVDSAIFIASKSVYKIENDRIGKNPFLFTQNGYKSFDVDWEDDFKLAELIYKQLHEQ